MRRSPIVAAVDDDLCVDSDGRDGRNSNGIADQHSAARALKQCATSRSLQHGRRLHCLLLMRYGTLLPISLSNCLVQMYGHCGYPSDAQKSFDAIPNPTAVSWTILIRALGHNGKMGEAQRAFSCVKIPDIVTWNAMIGVYAKNRNSQDAFCLFANMLAEGPAPSAVTFVSVLDACSDLLAGFSLHTIAVFFDCESNTTVGNALITMYGRCDDVPDAQSIFSTMSVRDVVTWSTLIAQFNQNERRMDALQLFCDMLRLKFIPSHITCISVLDACTNLGKLEYGLLIHIIIIECAFENNIPVSNALINLYGKCGRLVDAKKVFNRTERRNIVTWSSLMGALSSANSYNEA